MDLDIEFVRAHGSASFAFKIYRIPGNAYAYLPYGSHRARHVFRGWFKAEMQRLLTHSSNPSVWLEVVSTSACATEAAGLPRLRHRLVLPKLQLEPASQDAGA
jgi:hypothetical protein